MHNGSVVLVKSGQTFYARLSHRNSVCPSVCQMCGSVKNCAR